MKEPIIYIVDRHGKPLMPSHRPWRIRKLMKAGLAVPICNDPFTVRLKYDVPGYTQPVHVGIDSGRENIGVGASLDNGENIFLADVQTNNRAVTKAMKDRAEFRRQRRRHRRQKKQRRAHAKKSEMKTGGKHKKQVRIGERKQRDAIGYETKYPKCNGTVTSKGIHGKEAKIANRRRDLGWITPSARQLVQMHLQTLKNVMKFLPVTDVVIEGVKFDFQKMENPSIRPWEYQKGAQYGFDTVKKLVFDRQKGKCYLCGRPIEQYHHANPRKKDGSDAAGNLVGLCADCHRKVHSDKDLQKRIADECGKQKIFVSVLNSAMPMILEQMNEYCRKNGISFTVCGGKDTAETRKAFGIPKDHCTDGYAISLYKRHVTSISLCDTVYIMRRFKKKSGNIIQKLNKRLHRFNGEVVATNRHRAMDQKEPSLDEYMAEYAKTHSEKECARHLHELEICPAKRTYTYHKNGRVSPIHPGDTVRYEKYNRTKRAFKHATFVAEEIDMASGKVKYEDPTGRFRKKSPLMKYCQRITSGCLKTFRVRLLSDVLADVKKKDEKYMKITYRIA